MTSSSSDTTFKKLQWQQFGLQREKSIDLPPKAISSNQYFLVYDEDRESIVYAFSPDYHQFGHAWEWDGNRWTEISKSTFRLGYQKQVWSGFYDSGRKGVVGWNFDDDVPVGVLIKDRGVDVLIPEKVLKSTFENLEEQRFVRCTGELPILNKDSDWDELSGIFGYDPKRNVTVCITEIGVWELNSNNVWKKCFIIPEEFFPKEVYGNEAFMYGGDGAFYDTIQEKLVFWFVGGDDYELCLFTWNGKVIDKISTTGLPEDVFGYLGLSAHNDYNAVLYAGETLGYYGLLENTWHQLELGKNPPPRFKSGSMVFNPKTEMLMLGPGEYEESPGGVREEQHVFYVLNDSKWTKQGSGIYKSYLSEIRKSGRWNVLQFGIGGLYAVSYQNSLHTAKWDDDKGWLVFVEENASKSAFNGKSKGAYYIYGSLIYDDSGNLLAINEVGEIFWLAENDWIKIAESFEDFNQRSGFCTCYDPRNKRIVVWGGDVKNRQSNHTFFFSEGEWSKVKKASPRPKDFSHGHGKDDIYPEYDMIYDTKLNTCIRFGYEEVAVLEGDIWNLYTPANYKNLIRDRYRKAVHDSITGETLIVNFYDKTIVRFDFKECTLIGSYEWPIDFIENHKEDDLGPRSFPFDNDYIYNPMSKTLLTFNKDDQSGNYYLDLSDVFEATVTMGERSGIPKIVGEVEVSESERLYCIDDTSKKFWSIEYEGKNLTRTWGAISTIMQDQKKSQKTDSFDTSDKAKKEFDKLLTQKSKKGYVPADKLKKEQLLQLGCRKRWNIHFKDVTSEGVDSYFGGLPSGITGKRWPMYDDEDPMSFLFQIRFPEPLESGAAGVAVFCCNDGTATEDEDNNAVLLLSEDDFKKGPLDPPEDYEQLPKAEIVVGEESFDIDELLLKPLLETDEKIAAAFESLREELDQDAKEFSKLGGVPEYIQGGEDTGEGFIGQFDFDYIKIEDPLGMIDELGLFGAIYLFESSEETGASCFWEYT